MSHLRRLDLDTAAGLDKAVLGHLLASGLRGLVALLDLKTLMTCHAMPCQEAERGETKRSTTAAAERKATTGRDIVTISAFFSFRI